MWEIQTNSSPFSILLAKEGRLHVIIVHLKNGKQYLRPEYQAKRFEELI